MSYHQATNNRQNVLGYPIDLINKDQVLHLIENAWDSRSSMHVVTLNAEMIIAAQNDERLGEIIRQAELVIADGAGVVLALQLKGQHIRRLPGIELAQFSLANAAQKKIPVALIGGSIQTLNALYQHLPQTYPGLNLVACHDGYFDLEKEQSIILELNASGAQLVLVAMGVPKQEYFIRQAGKQVNAVFIGVGGSFDIWSGNKTRAPLLFRELHLEWLYRLYREPWRYKRMASALPTFAWQVASELLKKDR
jgi:N-acetylglucosaminyldiphosphoundecaprenol N-acetyl-beta-D-mannosaminyltransferase